MKPIIVGVLLLATPTLTQHEILDRGKGWGGGGGADDANGNLVVGVWVRA